VRRVRRCWPGCESQPYAGGLGLRHRQLCVCALGASPRWQAVRQHTLRGLLQVEGARRRSAVTGVVIQLFLVRIVMSAC